MIPFVVEEEDTMVKGVGGEDDLDLSRSRRIFLTTTNRIIGSKPSK